jgi:hypothetical protein
VTLLGLLFLRVLPINKKKLFRGPFKEHAYQVWFQMAQWFQKRRLKTDNTFFDTFVRFVSFVYFQSTKNINFLGDYPLAIPTKFGSNRTCGFREED